MDYANFDYLELLSLIPIPLFIWAVIYDCKYANDWDKGDATILAGMLCTTVFFSIGIAGCCFPNAPDDAQCQEFLRNCDHSLVEMGNFGWPQVSVTYDGVVVFPYAIRRSAKSYWNTRNQIEYEAKPAQTTEKKEQIINNIIKKGLE